MITFNAHNNFHARICMFTAERSGRRRRKSKKKADRFTSAHCKKHTMLNTHTHVYTHTHTHTHTHRRDKWEAELQATMKEVRLEGGTERMIRVCLPDAPGQGIRLGRGDISKGSLATLFCLTLTVTVLGPRNIKKSLSHCLERTRWSVWRKLSSER